ncbi:putative phosphohistidine phosphatase, SixA [Methylobacterium sp. 4-46]|uniref:histidine phosphatase family protein n=1 Tax=unclassified Methylobacterium TaxID=2615210 RepID=UPI000152DD14|nr:MULTISPECIES: histidine phosphatase family protein [Methylobacterium]ACA17561.1 putative phosphohistidine phosphatase, SixA [Methylobacterium sp. 4-46]WFT83240.1 histidine phosphatase family protein [Methylobacterium nodulans]
MPRLLPALLVVLSLPALAGEDPWAALKRDGTVALLRHARAPGFGDPPGLRLDDCATQRNLSDEGRAQARQIGEGFRRHGIAVGAVLASRWCRAQETARLAFGRAEGFPPLDSVFAQGDGEAQSRAVRARIAAWRGPGILALVTHQVNITALTGLVPAEGEVVVLRAGPDGTPAVIGRLTP